MRTLPKRLLGSAGLLTCTLGLQACGGGATAPESAAAPAFKPVASVDQVMDSIIIPSSQRVFDSVVYSNGELVASPKTDDEWMQVQLSALAVAEAANLLIIPGRAIDTGDWTQMSLALNAGAVLAASAAEKKDIEAVLTAGSEMYAACTACHEKYIPEP